MTTGRGLARAGLIVTIAFLVSRLLGWVRLVVIGTTFGVNGETDTFFAAFRIPDLIFQLVAAGALSSALIPIVSGLLANGEEKRAWRVASTVANVMMAVLLVLALVVLVLAPAIVPAVTPGFSDAQQAQTIELTRIMLASPILLALGSLATSLLNSKNRFSASALAPIVYNLAIIGGRPHPRPDLRGLRPGLRGRGRVRLPSRRPAPAPPGHRLSLVAATWSWPTRRPASPSCSWSRGRSGWAPAS